MPEVAGDLVLRARGLVKQYKRVRAVDGVELDVAAGERVALLGPNGAGKTTTLMMLLGVVSPDSGCGRGRAATGSRVIAARRWSTSASPPATCRCPSACGCASSCTCSASSTACAIPRRRWSSAWPGSASRTSRSAMGNELSSGQRTLVGIVKATLHQPRLLVLDEPTASLDPDVALRVRNGLERLCADEGTALLVTSHNMIEVERLCERVVFVSGGQVVADGTPAEVAAAFGRDDLEAVFLHLAERAAERAAEERL